MIIENISPYAYEQQAVAVCYRLGLSPYDRDFARNEDIWMHVAREIAVVAAILDVLLPPQRPH